MSTFFSGSSSACASAFGFQEIEQERVSVTATICTLGYPKTPETGKGYLTIVGQLNVMAPEIAKSAELLPWEGAAALAFSSQVGALESAIKQIALADEAVSSAITAQAAAVVQARVRLTKTVSEILVAEMKIATLNAEQRYAESQLIQQETIGTARIAHAEAIDMLATATTDNTLQLNRLNDVLNNLTVSVGSFNTQELAPPARGDHQDYVVIVETETLAKINLGEFIRSLQSAINRSSEILIMVEATHGNGDISTAFLLGLKKYTTTHEAILHSIECSLYECAEILNKAEKSYDTCDASFTDCDSFIKIDNRR